MMEEKNVSKKKKKSVVFNQYKPNGGEIYKRLYKAALTGHVSNLNQILKTWGDQFSTDELEDGVFKVYTELKLNNIRLEEEVELLLHEFLMRRFFFSKISTTPSIKTNDIKTCIQFLVDLVDFVKFFTDESEVLMFCLKCIVKKVHQLKQMLISTYDDLPWVEMEFYLFCYIISCTEQHDLNVFHHTILKKAKLIKYLEVFATALEKVQVEEVLKLSKFPDLKRDEVVQKIISNYPDFNGLFKDFESIRDIHSLYKISKYAELLKSVQLQEIKGKQFIIMIIQVISQHLKYTVISPKLTKITADLLLLSVTEDSRRALIYLRNSISWDETLIYKKELINNSNEKLLRTILNDLIQMGQIAEDLLFRHCLRLFRTHHAQDIVENLTLLRQIKVSFPIFHLEKSSEQHFCPSSNNDKLVKILRQLTTIIPNEDPRHIRLKKIIETITCFKTQDFKLDILLTYVLNQTVNGSIFDPLIVLNSDDVRDLLKILLSVQQDYNENKYEIARLNAEVINLLRFGIDSDDWIENFDKATEMNQDLFVLDRNEMQKGTLDFDGLKRETLQELKSISDKITYAKLGNDRKSLEILKSLILDFVYIENKGLKHRPILFDYLETDYELNDLIFNSKMAVFHIANAITGSGNLMNNENISKCKTSFSDQFFIVMKKQKVFSKLAEGDFEAFKQFLENGVEIKTKDVEKSTLIHLAAEKLNSSQIDYFCNKGLGINCKNIRLQTPLHRAVIKGNSEVVSYFAKRNKEVLDWIDDSGKTALHTAVLNQHHQIVQTLVNAGSNIFIHDQLGLTPLHYAVLNKNKDLLVSLLHNTNSTDISIQHPIELNTIFIYAMEQNYVDIVEFLLSEQYITLGFENGTSAVLSAVTQGQLDVLEILLRYGANPANCILTAVQKELDLVVEKLLQSKSDEANASNPSDRMTALHYAAINGNLSIIDILLKYGANVNSKNVDYYTPLHFAVINGHLKVVEALLEKEEIDINALDSKRYTPFLLAVKIGRRDIVETMLKKKWELIEMDSKDLFTDSPLQLARKEGHNEIAELLINNGAPKSYKLKNNSITPSLMKKIIITQKTLENPSVIIRGIEPEYYKCSNDEIITKIIDQNEMRKNIRNKIEIKLKYLKEDKCNIIMELEESLYNEFMEKFMCRKNPKNINIGWNICSVSDYYHLFRCYRCKGYSHVHTECENEEICDKCSGKHNLKDCQSKEFRCMYCVDKNKSLGLKLDVNHSPRDQRCKWYKKQLKDKYEKQCQVFTPK